MDGDERGAGSTGKDQGMILYVVVVCVMDFSSRFYFGRLHEVAVELA